MVAYESKELFPRPLAGVWELLQLHLDDAHATQIHPLIRTQRTINRDGPVTVVERTIDVRGTAKTSRWKITYNPPTTSRWEILESAGPWSTGSWIENSYSEAPGGTMVQTRGDLKISALPFFLSQKKWTAKVLDIIWGEDIAFVNKSAPPPGGHV